MSDGARALGASNVIYVFPTISPQIVVIPIVSCIIVFPIVVLIVICALRYRAMRARRFDKLTRGRRLALTGEHEARAALDACKDGRPFVQCKNGRRKTVVRFKPMPELDLDTVVEERSEFDAEVNAMELLQAPQDPSKLCVINHPISFRSFRFGYGASGLPLKRTSHYERPIGSPKPKRAREASENTETSTDKKTSEQGTAARSVTTNTALETPSPFAELPLLTTDVDNNIVTSDSAPLNCTPEVNALSYDKSESLEYKSCIGSGAGSEGSFVIPSVSVQSYREDVSSEESFSYIDKSEEVQLVNELSNSAVRLSTVGYQSKLASTESTHVHTSQLPRRTSISDSICPLKSGDDFDHQNFCHRKNASPPRTQLGQTGPHASPFRSPLGTTGPHTSPLRSPLSTTGPHASPWPSPLSTTGPHASSLRSPLSTTGPHASPLRSPLGSTMPHASSLRRPLGTTGPHASPLNRSRRRQVSHKPTHLDDPLDNRQIIQIRRSNGDDDIKLSNDQNYASISTLNNSDDDNKFIIPLHESSSPDLMVVRNSTGFLVSDSDSSAVNSVVSETFPSEPNKNLSGCDDVTDIRTCLGKCDESDGDDSDGDEV
ncbi:putative GPI-anchored protein pfl2 [Hyalella azteca]|uniref:GPI-anchored protein pfl2 n=1 Tax=Hyalella azteca TaxID=294128 RepID=A0A979FGI7_HYAAZ|nr:putative GPI-anchored protein pfl2 [Hyalella azteca]